MIFTLILNFALAFQPTPKAACDTRDLRRFLGPVRNQGDLDWCYANAAADLLQFAVGSQEAASATYLALLYNHAWEDSPIAVGGNVKRTLQEVLNSKEGYCTQTRENYIFRAQQKTTLKQKLRKFRDLKTAYDQKNQLEFEKLYSELSTPGSILNELDKKEFLNLLQNSEPENVFVNFADYTCGEQNKRPINREFVIKELDSGAGADLLRKLHQLLSQNQIASMSFNATFLRRDVGELNDFMFRHASVVAGRRWNDKTARCEILVRNSWGATCDPYRSLVSCDQTDPGNIWVREEILEQTILGVTFFEKK